MELANKIDLESDDYPIDAFPLIIANAIKKSSFYHNVPLAVAGQAYLGEMAYIAQSQFDAPSDKDEGGQPCSLFVLTIFPSGEGKDVCKNDAGKISKKIESKNIQNYQNALKSNAAQSSNQRKEPPKSPISIFKKATIQGIIAVMTRGSSNSFIWSTGEGGYLFSGYSLKSDTAGEALSTLNDLVDIGAANTVLKNENDCQLFNNKRFSLDISVQNIIVKAALNSDLLKEQGILSRVIFVAADPLPHRKRAFYGNSVKPYQDEDLKLYWAFCERVLTTSFIANPENISKSGRILVKKTNEANDLHDQYQDYIGDEVEKGGKYEFIRNYAKRTNQYVLRVATVLAFFEEKEIIDESIMKNAISICIYSLNQWVKYYDTTNKSDSEVLLDWLNKQKSTKVLKSSINQKAPKILRDVNKRNAAIDHLIDLGYIKIEKIEKSEYVVIQIKDSNISCTS